MNPNASVETKIIELLQQQNQNLVEENADWKSNFDSSRSILTAFDKFTTVDSKFRQKNFSEANIKKFMWIAITTVRLYITDSNAEDESEESYDTTATDDSTENNTESRCIKRKHQWKNNSRKIKEAKIL